MTSSITSSVGQKASVLEITRFRPRFPWLTGDLQTLRNTFTPTKVDFSPYPARSLSFPMEDGTGDVLTGKRHEPVDPADAETPLVVLIHGLTGCFDSEYVKASALALLRAGYLVLRLNLRAAGPINAACREQYHAGRTQDLAAVFAQLADSERGRPLYAVGYSLGANMLLKYLGETRQGALVQAAASVSAPIDLAAAAREMMRLRNGIYHRYLLKRMKATAVVLRGGLPPVFEKAVANCSDVYEFDDLYIGPRYDFGDAESYYAQCSAGQFLQAVKKPTLIVHAADDPWLPFEPYRQVDWSACPALVPRLTQRGGHVGFHQIGSRTTWHDHCVLAHFSAQAL